MPDDRPLSEDSYWRFDKQPFFALLPPPGKLTIDIGKVIVAHVARLPFGDGAADLAIAFMSLHDVDDMPGAIQEAGRSGGFVVEALTEPTVEAESVAERADRARWQRPPLFLELRARKR